MLWGGIDFRSGLVSSIFEVSAQILTSRIQLRPRLLQNYQWSIAQTSRGEVCPPFFRPTRSGWSQGFCLIFFYLATCSTPFSDFCRRLTFPTIHNAHRYIPTKPVSDPTILSRLIHHDLRRRRSCGEPISLQTYRGITGPLSRLQPRVALVGASGVEPSQFQSRAPARCRAPRAFSHSSKK